MRARALRQVSKVAFFGRHGEDLTACFEGGASAGRRECRIANHARDFFELRAGPGQIARHFDVELLRLTRLGIDEIDVARLFVNNCIRARRSSHDVEIFMMRNLCQLLSVSAISKQVVCVIAI